MTDVLQIRAAGPERIDALAEVFSRAFADDPMIRWPLPDAPDLPDRTREVFASIYLDIADQDVIWEAGDADGFAVWIPAGAADDMFESDAAVRAQLAPLTDDDGERYELLWTWIEERVPEDVWYLDALGVEPGKQGAGIGSALIRHGLAAAALASVDAFLETGQERNVAYYERFGFRIVDHGSPTPDGPHIWFMRTGA
ncbi:MAG: GNAT family N-acetyltransferase [Actinomycetota bacterium]